MTKPSRAAVSSKLYGLCALVILLAVWQVLTCFYSPLVVPTIPSVWHKMAEIVTGASSHKMILLTLRRFLTGLLLGVPAGFLVGTLMGYFRPMHQLLSPILGVMQTVPPVSWVVLALVWFGFNGRPTIFIVVISTLPVMAISICQGIGQIDKNLLEMAGLYRFSRPKQFLHVILPSIKPYFVSALKIVIGSGWKITVMGEVLTTSDGIGGMIKLARLNIEPETIIAWSVLIVLLFYLTDWVINLCFKTGGDHALH